MKTKEELEDLKNECNRLSEKLKELSDEELKYVSGGDVESANVVGFCRPDEHNIMLTD